MQRDMDLIRRILIAVEAREGLRSEQLDFDQFNADEIVVGRHIEMLHAVGLIDGTNARNNQTVYAPILVRDLTWQGHDFLAAIRNDTVWSKLKNKFSAVELAALPLSVIKDLAVGLTIELGKQKLGLSA